MNWISVQYTCQEFNIQLTLRLHWIIKVSKMVLLGTCSLFVCPIPDRFLKFPFQTFKKTTTTFFIICVLILFNAMYILK